jgi:hypothetical protein
MFVSQNSCQTQKLDKKLKKCPVPPLGRFAEFGSFSNIILELLHSSGVLRYLIRTSQLILRGSRVGWIPCLHSHCHCTKNLKSFSCSVSLFTFFVDSFRPGPYSFFF